MLLLQCFGEIKIYNAHNVSKALSYNPYARMCVDTTKLQKKFNRAKCRPTPSSHTKGRVIDTACIVCEAWSIKGRESVRLSVCLSHRSTAATACGGFAAERPAGRR